PVERSRITKSVRPARLRRVPMARPAAPAPTIAIEGIEIIIARDAFTGDRVCVVSPDLNEGGAEMNKRSVVGVILLSIITFGIYALVWFVKTKGEMVKHGAAIPPAWLLIVPIANP